MKFYITQDKQELTELYSTLLKDGFSITTIIDSLEQYGTSSEWQWSISPELHWGTYTMPNAQSQLRKRATDTEQAEEPLEASFLPVESTTSSGFSTFAEGDVVKGILPACFPSQSTCESLTKNCSSHGSCSLQHTDSTAKDGSPFKKCYACSCKASKNTDSEGRTKTTYWGGPACQKKDISTSFWIIALFTVGLVGLVSFAVGTVWSMGEEELPSVIGAGVSGPSARR